jgi:hypothetical protein
MDIFHLFGIDCHLASTDCTPALSGGGELDWKLRVFHGGVSLLVHFELDLQVL